MNERLARREHIINTIAGWGIIFGVISHVGRELDSHRIIDVISYSFWKSMALDIPFFILAGWLLGIITWKVWGRKQYLMIQSGEIKTVKPKPIFDAIFLLFIVLVLILFIAIPMRKDGHPLPQSIMDASFIIAVSVFIAFIFVKAAKSMFVHPLKSQELNG